MPTLDRPQPPRQTSPQTSVPAPRGASRARTFGALAGYARLSKNPDGSLLSVARQITTGDAHAAANGHRVAEWFADDDLSAWDETITRPGWESYLAALDSGDYDGALSYHFDRLARNGTDSERLITVCRRRGLTLITRQQEFDLAGDGDDRMVYRLLTAVAINQSDATSRRVRDHKDDARRRGNLRTVLGGSPPVGYRDGEADWEPEPRAVVMLRDVAGRVLRGEPLSAAFAAQPAVLDARGRLITEKMVRAALLRPATAGIMTARDGSEMGVVVDDPPLGLPAWRALQAQFASRKRGRPAGGRYPLGPLLRCGKCGNQLTGEPAHSRPYYRCANPHPRLGVAKPCRGVSVPAEDAHTVIRMAVEAWAEVSPDFAAASARQADLTGRQAELTAEVDRLREWMADLIDKRTRGYLTIARFNVTEAEIARLIDAAQAELATVAQVAANPLPAEIDWPNMTGGEQRAMVAEALETPITVAPGNGGARALTALDRMAVNVRQGGGGYAHRR
jgi:DNA invertase Pin-like site-specific DNA recombinase